MAAVVESKRVLQMKWKISRKLSLLEAVDYVETGVIISSCAVASNESIVSRCSAVAAEESCCWVVGLVARGELGRPETAGLDLLSVPEENGVEIVGTKELRRL